MSSFCWQSSSSESRLYEKGSILGAQCHGDGCQNSSPLVQVLFLDWQPTRCGVCSLCFGCDSFCFPGFQLFVVVVWLLSHVPLFRDPMDCRLPGSSVHGILHARILEWVAMSFFRGSSCLRDQTRVSLSPAVVCRLFTTSATWEALNGISHFRGSLAEVFMWASCFLVPHVTTN